MALRFYISSENAPFFNNNTMGYGNAIPTSGTYKVGDFIISSTQQNGIFGWVCTVAGTPGTWEVIGSGNGGDGTVILGEGNIVGYFNAVEFTDVRSSIEIGIPQYINGEDFLEVHYNGLLLVEGIHYNVSDDGLKIEVIGDPWNKDADDTQQMIFRVIKSEGVVLKELNNTININVATTEVEIGIDGYVQGSDIIEVHLNGVLLVEGVDYNVVDGKLVKIDQSEPWNMYNVQGQKMFVKVFKNTGLEIKPGEGTVTLDTLDPEVLEKIEASMTITDVVVNNTNNITNIDERLTAIEEKIESGDIVTNGGGGSVKLTYKDNLVEVVNTNTVAIGLEFDKEKDMLEVHIDGLKLAEGVHYNISEDGLSIVKVDGVWNPDSLEDQYIDFRVITAGNEQIEHLTNNIEFSSPMTEVEIGLEYEHGVDILIVHLNGIKLVEGLDFEYVAEGNKIVKIDTSEPWNLYAVDGQLFVIDVLRNVGEKVTMDDLADDVKEAIEAAGNIDISGKQDKTDDELVTTDKSIVGAINEVENETIDIKNSLVSVLLNKGISCNTDQSWVELFTLLVNNISSEGEDSGGEDNGELNIGQWNTLKSLGLSRSVMGVCAYDGKIYCLGGLTDSGTASNMFNRYDPSTDTWETLTSLSANIFGASCIGIDGIIHVFSQMQTPNSNECTFCHYYYDIASDSWSSDGDPQTSTSKLMPCAAFNDDVTGRIHLLVWNDDNIIGLKVYTEYNGFDYIYDNNSNAPVLYLGSANCYYDGKIYSIGGYLGESSDAVMQSTVYSYDTNASVMTTLTRIPVDIAGACAEVYDGKIYVFGGSYRDGSTTIYQNNDMFIYDIADNTWTRMEDIGITRVYAGSCIIDNKIYAIGGKADTDTTNIFIPEVQLTSTANEVFVIGEGTN